MQSFVKISNRISAAVGETLLCLFPSQERKRRLTPVWMFVVTLQICFPTPQIQENENKIQEEDNKIDTSRNISLLIATLLIATNPIAHCNKSHCSLHQIPLLLVTPWSYVFHSMFHMSYLLFFILCFTCRICFGDTLELCFSFYVLCFSSYVSPPRENSREAKQNSILFCKTKFCKIQETENEIDTSRKLIADCNKTHCCW